MTYDPPYLRRADPAVINCLGGLFLTGFGALRICLSVCLSVIQGGSLHRVLRLVGVTVAGDDPHKLLVAAENIIDLAVARVLFPVQKTAKFL